jgi:hypothetical protein
LNGAFLISYVKKNEWFHSPKTCLSHGKQYPLLGLSIPYRRWSPDHWPIVVQKSFDFRFLLFLLNKRNALEKSTVYYFNPVTFYWSTCTKPGGSFICVLGISNLHIPTIFLLNVGTFPTVWYIFFSFYYRLWKKQLS